MAPVQGHEERQVAPHTQRAQKTRETLKEGVDYTLDNDSGKPFVEPGEYDITLFGAGDYVDMLITTFVIDPAEQAGPAETSKSESAKSSASQGSSTKSATGTKASSSSSSSSAAQKGGTASTIAKTGDPFLLAVIATGLVALVAVAAATFALWRRSRTR